MSGPVNPDPSPIRFGVFEVDLSTRELRKSGLRIRLEGQPFQILKMLVERPGQLVTREELKKSLWPADTFVDFEIGINAAVKRLREALDDSADNPRFIETLPRRGYRFICPVESPSGGAYRQVPLRGRWVAGVLIGLLGFGGVLAFNFVGLRDRFFVPSAAPAVTSIAVLPFENLTGNPEQEYFADGLTDQLTTVLGGIKALRVPSRTSAMTFKDKRKPLQEIASKLRVEGVVEGSVVRSEGGVWTINLQLIHAPTDRHLWAKSYTSDAEDLSTLPMRMARDILAEAGIAVTPEEQANVLRSRPVDRRAFKAYLRGDYYYRKRTREDLYRGIEHFREAIDLDPTYAAAYDGLANCYWLLCAYSHLSPQEAFPKAKAAARRAVELDDTLGRAHATLAHILLVADWDWEGAGREFERARQLERSYPLASFYLVAAGRFEEAIAAAKEAVDRDPLTPTTSQSLAWVYFLAGRYDESVAQLKKVVELDPRRPHPHDMLARNYAKKKMYAEAVHECDQALTLVGDRDDPVVFSDCGWVYAVADRRAHALQLDQKLRRPTSPRWVDPLFLARVQLGLGNRDRAMELLYEAYRERSPDLVLLKASEIFGDELATDPRFRELLRLTRVPW